MSKKTRLIALLLALFLCSGCSGGGTSVTVDPIGAYSRSGAQLKTVTPARTAISMVFYEDMDTDPLTATNRENHELLKLVYSPLLRVGADLRPEYVLAESVEMNGTDVTVTLKSGLLFSDGSAVRAQDVEASIKTIRGAPDSPYYDRLQNVKSWAADGERILRIRLREPDVDFINCLDLPVCKAGEAIGCGPYQFSTRNGSAVLAPNPHYFDQPFIETIELRHPKDAAEKQDMFSVGLLDLYFEPAESNASFSGGRDYRVQTYPGDNLIFLGVNCQKPGLNTPALRRFFSSLPDREKLAEGVLLGQADAAAYPFQPRWHKAEGLAQNTARTAQELKEAAAALGLTRSENALMSKDGKQISFSLLIPAGHTAYRNLAGAVAESYALSGVRIRVEEAEPAEYTKRITEGNYQLYLGEIKTGRTLSTALFAGGAADFSGGDFTALAEAAAQYRGGALTLTEFAAAFDAQTPVFPLVYRQGVIFAAADLGDLAQTGSWSVYGDFTLLKTLETERTS